MNEQKADWIFYLRLNRNLSSSYFALDEELKKHGHSLIPVTISELISLTRGEGNFYVFTSITGVSELNHYIKKVQKVFHLLLRNKRMNLFITSSFQYTNETALFGKSGQYHYFSLPVGLKQLCDTISLKVKEREENLAKWPGGTRRLGSTIRA